MEEFAKVVGLRIKSARGLRMLGQKELADMMGVSSQTVSNWENGRRLPDARSIHGLSVALDCSADYLLGTSQDIKGA